MIHSGTFYRRRALKYQVKPYPPKGSFIHFFNIKKIELASESSCKRSSHKHFHFFSCKTDVFFPPQRRWQKSYRAEQRATFLTASIHLAFWHCNTSIAHTGHILRHAPQEHFTSSHLPKSFGERSLPHPSRHIKFVHSTHPLRSQRELHAGFTWDSK